MPGVTKHIYDHDVRDIQDMWGKQIKSITGVLPQNYTQDDIVSLLKRFYPHEWDSVVYKKRYYDIKDRHIAKHKGKPRYRMPAPEKLLERNTAFRGICTAKKREQYQSTFDEEIRKADELDLWKKRAKKIERIDNKIKAAKSKTQTVTPDFIDQLIGLYERKNTSQKDRMYIIYELKKYYTPKVIDFFFKCNDTEVNEQLRRIAFEHLQSFNYQPRFRRQKYMKAHTKNRRRKEYIEKQYAFEKYSIPFNPQELEYRIANGKEQKIKGYEYFISHSSKDAEVVQKLIDYENENGILVFCDWINDSDYLKRNLVCESTLKVIEWRLEQSKAIIFVDSEMSRGSVWCQYELNYFYELGRAMYIMQKADIDQGIYEMEAMDPNQFHNTDYRELALIEKRKISEQEM